MPCRTRGMRTMPDRVRRILLIGALVSALVPALSSAQEPGILRAAASSMAEWLRQDSTRNWSVPIEIDPRILGLRGPLPAATNRLHHATMIAGTGVDGVARPVPLERAVACSGIAQQQCRQNGVFIAATFTVPVVDGDSASVEAFLRVSLRPTTADSAIARQAGDTAAAFRRLGNESGSGTRFRFALVRRDGDWVVTSRTIRGQS